jgi:glycerate 2-kinase
MADGCEGFIEALAVALGAELVTTTVRDALGQRIETGVGQLITAALERSARRLIVGLGGSAANDGGAGMLPALGVRFLKADRCDLDGTPAQPRDLASLDLSDLDPRLAQTTTEWRAT